METTNEAALHMRVGGRRVARQQLRHLIDMSLRDHITLRVLPFDVGAFPGSGQSVQLDQFHGPVLLDAVEGIALSPAKSRTLSMPSSRAGEGAGMGTRRWRKSSYCQEGGACVHISPAPSVVHIADAAPPRAVLTVSAEAFAALLDLVRSSGGG